MRRIIKFGGGLLSLLLGVWLICYIYDHFWGNNDGLLANVAYNNLVALFLRLALVGWLLILALTVPVKMVQNLALSVLSSIFFLGLLEAIGHLVIGLNLITSAPLAFRRFYIFPGICNLKPYPAGDLHPVTGRSHVPNGSFCFTNCLGDSIRWTYNSAGSNDKQRDVDNPDPAKKRIAFLGDSFLEGYMVNNPKRLSNLLEQQTGLEHLNFAVYSSGPIHYYLTYKTIAKAYGADVVIVGFLAANDFEIYSTHQAYQQVDWPQYIPYWQGVYPHYTLRYSLANVDQSILHGNHTQASLLKVVDSVYASLPFGSKLKADFLTHSSIIRVVDALNTKAYREGSFTKYEQFSELEWQYVSYSLTKLIQEARGKKVLLLSIPTLWDLKALKRGKVNRLDPLLANFCQQQGALFIPLAPTFLASKQTLQTFYVPCDGHWSAEGEAHVAAALIDNPIYRSLVGLR
ncbi:hypothetical protein GCM10028805_57990 [Spirosoma harenae]